MRYTYKKTLLIISALFLLVSFNAFSQQTAVNDSVVLDEVIVTSLNIPKKQRAKTLKQLKSRQALNISSGSKNQ